MKRRFMLFIVVVGSACNRTQPSAPTAVPSVPLLTRHFSGVVLTEDGRPVPGATVWFLRSTTGVPYGTGRGDEVNATTDGSGFYQLAWEQSTSWTGTHAKVTQPLYEDTVALVPYMSSQTDVTQNFRLYQSVTLAAGQSAHLAITPDNSLCVGENEALFCRKVHITVPSSGTLVLDTIADDPSNTVWLSIGDVDSFQKVTHLAISMDTATTVVVMILRPWNMVAGGVTLKSALAPQ